MNVRQDGAALPETHRHEKRTKVLLNPRNFPRQKPVHNSIFTKILVNNFNWLARAEFSSKFPGMSLIGPSRHDAALRNLLAIGRIANSSQPKAL